MTREDWLNAVDRYVYQLAGCSVHDLPDVLLADWYDDGLKPLVAARRAIQNAREG